MRVLFLLVLLLTGWTNTAMAEPKSGWFFGFFRPYEWDNKHWHGLSYQPSVREPDQVLRAVSYPEKTLFSEVKGLKPAVFIENIRRAGLVGAIYQEQGRNGITVEVEPLFYDLSYTDQRALADLLVKSYEPALFILKDASREKIVGQIIGQNLILF